MRSSTIEDVAAAAGVSVATVSRALRGLPNVAPTTRARVQAEALRLDYSPNPAASWLAAGRSTMVAMVVPDLSAWYFAKVMAGAEAVFSEAGYDLLVVAVDSEDSSRRVLSGPLMKRVDGLISCNAHLTAAQAANLLARGVKLVSIGREHTATRRVVVDDVEIAARATRHLLDLGHRRIGLITGTLVNSNYVVPSARRSGHEAALAERGIVADPALRALGDFSIEGGARAMSQLLQLDRPPTAIFAMSDEMAFGALQVARERGCDVPGDLSVIGVDNHEFAPVVGLTTIDQDVGAHGVAAARLLLDALTGLGGVSASGESDEPGDTASTWSPETRLIVRSSTGPRR